MASAAEKLDDDTEVEFTFPRMTGKLKAKVLLRMNNPFAPGTPMETEAVIDLPVPDTVAKQALEQVDEDDNPPTDAHAVMWMLSRNEGHRTLVNCSNYIANSNMFSIVKVLAFMVEYDSGRTDMFTYDNRRTDMFTYQ